MRIRITLLLVLILLAPLISAIHIEASDGSVQWCGSLLTEPRWGAPEAVLSGKSFVIELSKSLEIEEAELTNGSTKIELMLEKLSDSSYRATVPDTAAPGVYDLVLYSGGKILCSEHNAVWVLKDYPRSLVLMLSLIHI